jgi:RimJ/RimL family protein N-acetyltransferase
METIKALKDTFDNYRVGHLVFRPLFKGDAFPLFDATRNPDFNQHLLWSAPETAEELITQVNLLRREHKLNRAAVYSMCDRLTGRWVGFIKFAPYLDAFSIAIWIHPNSWKSTVGFTASRFALEAAMDLAKVPKLYAYIKAENTPMQDMSEKCGYVYLKNIEIEHADGYMVDAKLYELTQENWLKNRVIGKNIPVQY